VLKKTVEYEDFNGDPAKEDLYFNLTRTELMGLEMSEEDGLSEYLQKIVEAENGKGIFETFQKIILAAYGKKSDDGRHFIKNQKMRDELLSSMAYDKLIWELVTNAEYAAEFINGVIPAGLEEEAAQISQRGPKPSTEFTGASEVRVLTKAAIESMSEEEVRELGTQIAAGEVRIED
jgi:hypothetical protein